MDWEAEGLLEGLDDSEREDRRRLLDSLHAEGVGIEELRRAVAEERLTLVRVERMLVGEPRYSMREIGERAGRDVEWQKRYRRIMGLAVPDPDEIAYSEEDMQEAMRGSAFFESGVPDDVTLEVERVLGLGMARYAEAFRLAFADAFMEPGDTESQVADRYAAAAAALKPLAGPHFAHVFFLHLRDLIRSDIISAEERRLGHVINRERMAVAFADLVGFTKLGEDVGHEELGGVVGRLTELTTATIESPVRLIKSIGDAVMLVSPEPGPLVDAALALVEAAEEAGLPPLRAGVAYGPAISRWGDWYGSTVNLASRLTERARPGTVLVEACVPKEVGDDGYEWSYAGEKKLKGFSTPVKAVRARRR